MICKDVAKKDKTVLQDFEQRDWTNRERTENITRHDSTWPCTSQYYMEFHNTVWHDRTWRDTTQQEQDYRTRVLSSRWGFWLKLQEVAGPGFQHRTPPLEKKNEFVIFTSLFFYWLNKKMNITCNIWVLEVLVAVLSSCYANLTGCWLWSHVVFLEKPSGLRALCFSSHCVVFHWYGCKAGNATRIQTQERHMIIIKDTHAKLIAAYKGARPTQTRKNK